MLAGRMDEKDVETIFSNLNEYVVSVSVYFVVNVIPYLKTFWSNICMA